MERSERGAVLILVAASLLFMMGMAALVVDGGQGFSERRQAQSAADFSTLAAVQFSTPGNPTAPECPVTMAPLTRAACRGAVEAMAVVDGNLPSAGLTPADWVACRDPDHFPVTAAVNFGSGNQTVECVSFNGTTQDGRVRVPDVAVGTSFGRGLGVSELTVNAFAEVHASLPGQSLVLPFGIPAGAGIFDCLKASPHPNWGVCGQGGTTGNYGYANIPTYGNPDLGTSFSNCNTPNSALLSNMIRGVDHPLGTHTTGTKSAANPGLRDGNVSSTNSINVCPIFGSNANEINVQTGVIQSIFEQGLTYGFGSSERGPMWGSLEWKNPPGNQPEVRLDDTPLWSYLTTTAFCPGGPPTTTQQMIDCLAAWTPSNGVIFSSAIASSGRYNFAPRFWVGFGSDSQGWYLIRRLDPIYLNTSYWGCTPPNPAKPEDVCAGIHAPGDAPSPVVECVAPPTPYTGNEPADATCAKSLPLDKNVPLNAVTSFNLQRGMLPATALDPIPADGPLIDFALSR